MPKPFAFWSACGAAGAIGLLYWILAKINSGSGAIDCYYYVSIWRYRLFAPDLHSARGHYTEFIDPTTFGTGLIPFPVATILPHALCVAAFGDVGFMVADVLISAGRYLLIFAILISISKKRPLLVLAIALAIVYSYVRGRRMGLSLSAPLRLAALLACCSLHKYPTVQTVQRKETQQSLEFCAGTSHWSGRSGRRACCDRVRGWNRVLFLRVF